MDTATELIVTGGGIAGLAAAASLARAVVAATSGLRGLLA